MSPPRKLATIGVVALLAVTAAGCNAISQQPGTINGIVYQVDDDGNPKPGAPGSDRVSLFDAESGNIVQTTTSGADGAFHFSVPAGRYAVSGGGKAANVRVDSGKAAEVRVSAPVEGK